LASGGVCGEAPRPGGSRPGGSPGGTSLTPYCEGGVELQHADELEQGQYSGDALWGSTGAEDKHHHKLTLVKSKASGEVYLESEDWHIKDVRVLEKKGRIAPRPQDAADGDGETTSLNPGETNLGETKGASQGNESKKNQPTEGLATAALAPQPQRLQEPAIVGLIPATYPTPRFGA